MPIRSLKKSGKGTFAEKWRRASCVLLERFKLALFWFCLPLLHCLILEIKSYRQTVHIKDDVKQKAQAKKTQNPCRHGKSKQEFSDNLYPGRGFPKLQLSRPKNQFACRKKAKPHKETMLEKTKTTTTKTTYPRTCGQDLGLH